MNMRCKRLATAKLAPVAIGSLLFAAVTLGTTMASAVGITGIASLRVEGKCLDLPAGNLTPGTQIDIWDCGDNGGGSSNQEWIVGPDGTIRPGLNASNCLDLKNGQTADGTPIVLEPCNQGPTQQWSFGTDGTVRGYGGKCIDDPGGRTPDGTGFDYWDCGGGANQSFTLDSYVDTGAITYPPCNVSNCTMKLSPPPNTDTVSLGKVNVYLLWYGNWSSQSASDPTYTFHQLVPQFVQGLNESSYESLMTTYYDAYGYVSGEIVLAGQWNDSAYSQGRSLNNGPEGTAGALQTELKNAIFTSPSRFPSDTNGVYIILTSPDVSVTSGSATFGNGFCGFNGTMTYNNANFNYAFVGVGSVSNGLCSASYQTPNQSLGSDTIGLVDHQISAFAHELNERITQAWGGPPGQEADSCNGKIQNTYYVTPNCGGSQCPPVPANAHLNNHDFLIQAQRVNGSQGSVGYCASSYGNVFWRQDYGIDWWPFPDWNVGSYKGECEPGQAVIGISTFTGSQIAHAVLCGDSENAARYAQSSSCTLAYFDGFSNYGGYGDWDSGSYIDNCPAGFFAAGVSQSTSGMLDGLLCCPGTGAGLTAQDCTTQDVGSNIPGADWDWGYYKAQCPSPRNDQYIVGVSASDSTGGPHAIRCCSP
jgi:Ricin-type beta-trefoil lectin domain/Phosphate-induced protein 1 conserved region